MARPTTRTPEIEAAIIEGICNGQSLPTICDNGNLPKPGTVFSWLASDEARRAAKEVKEGEVLFLDKYRIATQLRREVLAEEILSVSDDGRNDTYLDADGKARVDYDHIQRAKLRVDSRKWLLSKLDPKRYGDRPSEVNVATHVHNHIPVAKQKEWQQRRAEALQNGN